jgi:hypothetical protein
MSVARCMREIDSQEYAYWRAYAELEPFGPAQEDLRASWQPVFYYNAHRSRSQSTLKPGDLFPSLKVDEPRVTREQFRDMFRTFAQRSKPGEKTSF